jgi:hypothetical protein
VLINELKGLAEKIHAYARLTVEKLDKSELNARKTLLSTPSHRSSPRQA